MIRTSTEYQNALFAGKRQFVSKATITLKSGEIVEIDSSRIMQGGVHYTDTVSSSGNFDVGAAIINKFTLKLLNMYDEFSEYDFEGATVEPYTGLQLESTTEWLKKGVFVVDNSTFNGGVVNLSCLDNMSKFAIDLPQNLVTFPVRLDIFVRTICEYCKVELATNSFIMGDYLITEIPESAMTCLDAISYLAQIEGAFARCNAMGRLEIRWYNTSVFESESGLDGGSFVDPNSGDKADGGDFFNYVNSPHYDGGSFQGVDNYWVIHSYTNANVGTDDVIITGIRIDVAEESETITYLAGDEGYLLSITGNPFITAKTGKLVAEHLKVQLVGMRFRTLKTSILGDPAIEAGDPIYFVDREQRVFRCYLTNIDYTIGNKATIACDAKSPVRNSAKRYGAITQNLARKQAEIKEEIRKTADGKNAIHHGSTVPSKPNNEGDLWYEELADGKIRLRIYDGSSWDVLIDDATAEEAKDAAEEARQAGEEAERAAQQAQTAANNAVTVANQAQTAGNNAVTVANQAQTAANNAVTVANQARTAGNDAKRVADEAKQAGTNAQTVGNNALTAANQARTDAATAITNANNAVSAATTNANAIVLVNRDKADKSQITLLENAINLRVEKGQIINQINVSPESILIAGNKIRITGQTTIDNAVIGTAQIASGAITSAKIGNLAVGTAQIASGAITEAKIGNLAVGAAQIKDAAITSAKIGNLAVGTAKIANAAITNAKIGSLAVGTAQIASGAITEAKIGNLAVGAAQIKDAAITTAKIGNLAVGTAQIANAAITTAKIGSLAVGTAQIANAAITDAKIGSVNAGKITTGTLNAATVNIINMNASNISTGTMSADRVRTGVLQSNNYVPNTSGTRINLSNGQIDSKNFKLDATGNITANSGTLGNWRIGEYGLYNDNLSVGGAKAGIVNIPGAPYSFYVGRHTYNQLVQQPTTLLPQMYISSNGHVQCESLTCRDQIWGKTVVGQGMLAERLTVTQEFEVSYAWSGVMYSANGLTLFVNKGIIVAAY